MLMVIVRELKVHSLYNTPTTQHSDQAYTNDVTGIDPTHAHFLSESGGEINGSNSEVRQNSFQVCPINSRSASERQRDLSSPLS
ncbi:hypothetical protein NPIL_207631 [Nephila pilipes]|uniref:Uncharacterized protein n=1 Tax=Nephila pilipes TaxID=299642 RepID=A0A8X6MYH0_NEPPI|nr:hypothetical protein NPIL_207631 [Nephila pilipes]